MSKFKKLIRAFIQIIRNPSLLNLVLEENSAKQKYISKKYSLDKGLPTIDLLDLFPNFNYLVSPYSYQGGTCIPTDIALLMALSERKNANVYFEIGTWRGESVSNVSKIVNQCYTLNLSIDEMLAMGLTEKYAKFHGFYSKENAKIKHLYGNSLNFDFTSYFNIVDLVFVDGDHHYEAVKSDTINAFKLIKSENSVIVWHDYSNDTEDVRYDVLAAILDGCPADKRRNLYHVSNTLCAIYIQGEFNVSFTNTYEKPTKYFDVQLVAKKLNK